MNKLELNKDSLKDILLIGAHCDDVEIGCGGTLLTLIDSNPEVEITWIILTSTAHRKQEAETSARLFCKNAKTFNLKIHEFRDGFLPYQGEQVKDTFESLKNDVNPNLIFTHFSQDLHQDHRLISELTWNTFRNHLILEYEIPKWDGDFGTPNTYVHLDEEIISRKIKYIQQAYNSQHNKAWFTDDLFRSVLRIRGMESNSPTRFAEAFYTRKSVLNL